MKCSAKINLFLKILGKRSDGYCEIASRFARVDELFDEIFLIPSELARELDGMGFSEAFARVKEVCAAGELDTARESLCIVPKVNLSQICANFTESGNKMCKKANLAAKMPENTLCNFVTLQGNILSNFFTKSNIFEKVLKQANLSWEDLDGWCVALFKNIPTFAGLGGASSDAAGFMKLLKARGAEFKTPSQIGADVSFFASDLAMANVGGLGDEISAYDDKLGLLELSFCTECSTVLVFNELKAAGKFSPDAKEYFQLSNEELFARSNYELNDLLKPVLRIYPQAQSFAEKGYFLSGSGGTFFKFLKGENK